ncbi:hypothetical protein [Micromonospora sp. NBC_01813]|uniref:hypothetical protein n=1 Tax=Micromonospora sp. NBC_01813 TaxID=2975988 RepID=UPI002DDA7DCE|nr:hypothetical protein [Micromonospora sp. NBC_01813]WSA12922.1 hypothetical protein OG958_07195 [Micromonospora sp. NBC_01813]
MADSSREPEARTGEPGVDPPTAGQQGPGGQPWSPFPKSETWLERRRTRIAKEIARNRRGEYTVPTWVLAAALGLILTAWAVLIIVS